jgi:hypothetical protein
MGTFYDLLGHAIDIVLKVRLPWAIGNPLIKDESDRSLVPGEIEDYQLRHWKLCGHAVTGVPLKIRVRMNQKSELIAAWSEDAIHGASEFRLPV